MLDDGTESSDQTIILNKWRADFESLFNGTLNGNTFNDDFLERAGTIYENWTNNVPESHLSDSDNDAWSDILNSPLDIEETRRALHRAKVGKAVGVDNIPNEILKRPELLHVLHRLYSVCYEQNVIPTLWYKTIICPILKRGKDSRHPLNHRAISLMSTVAKVFSDIINMINNRIVYYMETRQLFADEQNGFRRMRSCLDHLYVLTTIIRNRKKDNLSTYVCYVDFTRAFDSVNHSLLWLKLQGYNISGNILNIIKTMYANIQSVVRLGCVLTDWFSITAGVRQGDNLAPTLFAIFVNDLVNDINALNRGVSVGYTSVSCLLYADDIVLIADSPDHLQDQLDAVYAWCQKWRLMVNRDKTSVMHFHKPSVPRTDHQFTFGDQHISYSDKYRYLGLELNEYLDYTHTANVLSDASGRALGAVTSRYYSVNGLHYDTYSKLYNNLVVPVMDYSSAIWGYKDYNKNNTVQHRAMRTFLGVGKYTAIPALYGELCWMTPHMRHQLDMIRLFVRLVNMSGDRLTHQVFKWDYQRSRTGTWGHEVKSILNKCGLDNYYNTFSAPGTNVVAESKQQLLVIQKNDWNLSQNMPKLVNYNKVKVSFTVPSYVRHRLTTKERSCLARLYCANLPLRVETGRYRNIPRDRRLCTHCDLGAVEDEIHFVTECSLYDDNRRDLMNYINGDDELSRIELYKLMCVNIPPKRLANFVLSGLIKRRNET